MLKALVAALLLLGMQPAAAETVHTGDRLGSRLPAGLSARAIAGLLVPGTDGTAPALVGAKPWPGHPKWYVAVASVRTDAPLRVYLGVISLDERGPRLVAKSGPLDGAMSWRDSGLPKAPMIADDAHGSAIRPDSIDGFDLAPYRIAPGVPAFGLRIGWTESYSDGGAYYGGLCLFAIDGNRLEQVFAAPMSVDSDVAGDWHKDGTRDHQITDAANVLIVSSHVVDRHFDLVVRSRTASRSRTFRWSDAAAAYRPL